MAVAAPMPRVPPVTIAMRFILLSYSIVMSFDTGNLTTIGIVIAILLMKRTIYKKNAKERERTLNRDAPIPFKLPL